MFKFEKDMLPIIEKGFAIKYKNAKCIKEFNSGNGISDLTLAIFNDGWSEITIQSYAEMHYLITFFNKIGKKIFIDKLISIQNLNKLTLASLIRKLLQNNFILEKENYYIVKKLYRPAFKNIVSVEAKLKKWRDGFYQAMRYKCFSHETYLAVPDEYIKNINVNLLKENDIGLISVMHDQIEIIIKPYSKKPNDLISYYHLSEKMLRNKGIKDG